MRRFATCALALALLSCSPADDSTSDAAVDVLGSDAGPSARLDARVNQDAASLASDAGVDAGPAEPTCDVHVRMEGSDTGTGSADAALRTIQRAAELSSAGTVVCVHGTDGFRTERPSLSRSGAEDRPIVFRALDSARVAGFDIVADHITVEGFEVTTDGKDVGSGIHLEGHGIVVRNNYVHHTGIYGIACEGNGPDETPRVTGSRIEGNTVAYVHGIGIWVEGDGNQMIGNDISRSFTTGSQDADGARVFGSNHRLADNYIHDIFESDSTTGPTRTAFSPSTRGASRCSSTCSSRTTFALPTDNCVIISNTSGALAARNIVVRGNVCHSRIGSNGFYIGHETGQDDSVDGLEISNNLIHAESGFFGVYSDNSRNVTLRNNVILGTSVAWQGEGTESGRGFVEEGNLFDVDAGFEDPTNPDARRRYIPGPDSVLIDRGVNTGVTNPVDLLGNPRVVDGDGNGTSVVDVGPYEHVGP